MNDQPTFESGSVRYTDWLILTVGLALLFIGIFSPVTALSAYFFERRVVLTGKWHLVLLTSSAGWLLALLKLLPVTDIVSLKFWILSLPLIPLAALTLKGVRMLSYFSKPKTLKEQLREEEAKLRQMQVRLGTRADSEQDTTVVPGWLSLGMKLKGDAFPEFLGVGEDGRWLFLDERVLDQHLFVLGSTGAGKSETIKRLVAQIMASTERNVYFVDGKGDEDLANDIRSLAYHSGRGEAPVFKLGFGETGAIYNGFRGSADVIYNRLGALIGVGEMEGDARYYADINRVLLNYLCQVEAGPPESFEEVVDRLDKQWLQRAYQNDARALKIIEGISEEHFRSLEYRLIPLLQDFQTSVGSEGFALEDVPCAIFSMRVQSVGDTSKRFLDFLVEDLKDFVGKRQRSPGVLIIDEFGQFSNSNIISLLTLARSSRLGVILATQDTASLKDEATKKLVLANTRTKLLMATDFPEEVGELAGTMYQAEAGMQLEDGEVTGKGTVRIQHSFKVDMNEAAKLQPGEAFLIRQRHAAKLKIRAVGAIDRIPPQASEQRELQAQPLPPAEVPPKKRTLVRLD